MIIGLILYTQLTWANDDANLQHLSSDRFYVSDEK